MIVKKNQVPAERAELESFGVTDTLRLSDAGGLSQYGAYVQTLHPGARSSNNHWHENEDELFLILQGHLRIEMEDGPVELDEGEMFVVPKGVRHNPVADEECHLLLIERKTTQHTGDVKTERTRSLADQLRPV